MVAAGGRAKFSAVKNPWVSGRKQVRVNLGSDIALGRLRREDVGREEDVVDKRKVDETEIIRISHPWFDRGPLFTIGAPDCFGLVGLWSITNPSRSTEESPLTLTQGGATPLSRLRSALGYHRPPLQGLRGARTRRASDTAIPNIPAYRVSCRAAGSGMIHPPL